MKNKEILANAPKGVNTHMLYDGDSLYKNLTSAPRSLADIQRIVELESENEKLKAEIKYVDAKVKSATQCHPRAVEYLLDEALSRTHFDNANEVPQ